jgi:hypothetical protein
MAMAPCTWQLAAAHLSALQAAQQRQRPAEAVAGGVDLLQVQHAGHLLRHSLGH